ncbi:hypothetical protein ETB97_002253 [Aspergillus alliaceus]|uniref:Uncharacterized protein n=1 Tax=Petromyces alliaceus TaxID=209559 RepID=A0A8H6A4A6_PETAA|nr:hypothetical protein ETB97_002253 [Aspergillus burnettii]
MGQHPASTPHVHHKPRELRRLYEPLSLLCALLEQMPEQKPIEVVNAGGVGGTLHHRRDFLNALVQLAAFKQGCDLAITAGYDDESVVIAVAGNQDAVQLLTLTFQFGSGKPLSAVMDGMFEIFKRYIRQSQRSAEMFEEFHRQLLSLVMPMEMSDLLLRSAISIRQDLQREIQVCHVPPLELMKIPLVRKKLNLDDIARRMFSENERFKQLSQGLKRVLPAPSRLMERLKYYQEIVYTQVHPELRVIDFFDKKYRLQYFDNYDRYIATSKPCCYLCSQYLSHRLNYHIRKCDRNDIDIHWRLPDIQATESCAHFNEQKVILRKITEHVRRDVESFVLDRCSDSNDSSMDDDTSQSFSLSTETTTTSEELSYGEASECPNPYRFSLGTEGDKHPGSGRCDGSENEDDEDTVVFRGRQETVSIT